MHKARLIPWYTRLAWLVVAVTGPARAAEPDYLPEARPLATTFVYDCSGLQVTARLGPGEMALWLPGRYVILSRVRSASGVKYREGDIQFWTHGEEASLTIGDDHYGSCRLLPGQVPWEDARRRGVDFRAAGNEPDWYLEIQRGRQLLFVGNDAETRITTPEFAGQLEGPVRVYTATTETGSLRVEIEDRPCFDSVSGQNLAARVLVAIDGRVYRGCGRDLGGE